MRDKIFEIGKNYPEKPYNEREEYTKKMTSFFDEEKRAGRAKSLGSGTSVGSWHSSWYFMGCVVKYTEMGIGILNPDSYKMIDSSRCEPIPDKISSRFDVRVIGRSEHDCNEVIATLDDLLLE